MKYKGNILSKMIVSYDSMTKGRKWAISHETTAKLSAFR